MRANNVNPNNTRWITQRRQFQVTSVGFFNFVVPKFVVAHDGKFHKQSLHAIGPQMREWNMLAKASQFGARFIECFSLEISLPRKLL